MKSRIQNALEPRVLSIAQTEQGKFAEQQGCPIPDMEVKEHRRPLRRVGAVVRWDRIATLQAPLSGYLGRPG
jgi:hypothetical protein